MFLFGLYQTSSCVGLFGVSAHTIQALVKHFVLRFELYENLSFLSSLEVLQFKVVNLPHLSWNLLQVAWFPFVLNLH